MTHDALSALPRSPVRPAAGGKGRLHQAFSAHYAFIWRLLRRLGVAEGQVDDLAQNAMLVLSRRLDDVQPGKERAFLVGTAMRLAARARSQAHSQEAELIEESLQATAPNPEELVDLKHRRQLLDSWLSALPLDLRSVFTLFELEGLSSAEIAELLELPVGTVKTRLRKARQLFLAEAKGHDRRNR